MLIKFQIVLSLSLLLLASCAGMRTVNRDSAPQSSFDRLAILPFESTNPYLPGNIFSDYFTVFVHRDIKGFQIVDRRDVARNFQEQILGLKNASLLNRISNLGFISGVDVVLIGSVQTLETIQSGGGTISVTVKMVEVPSGNILWVDKEKIGSIHWPATKAVEEVAEDLIEKSAKKMVQRMKKNFDSQLLPHQETAEKHRMFRETKLELSKK